MTVAKGLGGGLPIGACVTSAGRTPTCSQPGDHGSTFAGGPVIAAAAQRGARRGRPSDGFLADGRASAASGSRPACASSASTPRGRGLMLGFDVPRRARTWRAALLLEQRLVVNATGPDTVRLLPPLTVSEAEIDEAVRRLGAALQ